MRRILLSLIFFSLATLALDSSYAQEKPAESVKEKPLQTVEKTSKASDHKTDTNTKPTTKPTIRFPISSEKQFKNDIKHYLNADQVKPVLLGSDDFITLISEETTGNPKGVAILLSDWQQAATSPKAINFLRQKLPDLGWTTITIQSMPKPEHYPSVKIKKLAQNEENKKSLKEYQNKLAKIMTKVMKKAANYPGLFLVVAEGSNAAMLVNLYQQTQIKQPDVLVLLSAHLLTEEDNKSYAKALASIEVPVLDLYLKHDNSTVLALASLSRSQSKKQLKVYYRQRQLSNLITGYYPRQELLKAINGWLKHIGW